MGRIAIDDELERLILALQRERAAYALCGALAHAVHGAPRATRDIDLLALPQDDERIRAAAKSCGFVLESLPMTFRASGIRVRRHTKLIDGEPLMLDILWVDANLEEVWNDRREIAWRGGTMWCVSREGLIALKTTAASGGTLSFVYG